MRKRGAEDRRPPAPWALKALLFCVLVSCVKAQCSKPKLDEYVELSDEDFPKTKFPEGSSASLKCILGYMIESGKRKITCANGTWSELNLKCKKKSCESVGELLNGKIDVSEGIYHGAIVTFTCNTGYTLVGKKSMNCTERGWSARFPICDVAKCSAPTEIKNGRIVWKPEKEFPHYTDVIQYKCNKGYTLKGESEITCNASGEYDHQPPICQAPECKKPLARGNAVLTKADSQMDVFPDGSNATFECRSGFEKKEGSGIIFCNAGTWSHLTLQCQNQDDNRNDFNDNRNHIKMGVICGVVSCFVLLSGFIFYRRCVYRTREDNQKPTEGMM